jgi:hypothetical protein
MVNEVNDLKGSGMAILNSHAATSSGYGHSPRANGEAKAGPPSPFGRHRNAFPGGPPLLRTSPAFGSGRSTLPSRGRTRGATKAHNEDPPPQKALRATGEPPPF